MTSPSGHTEDPLHTDVSNQVNERSALLDSVRPGHSLPSEEDEHHAREVSSWNNIPWWKRPSPYWLIFGISMGSMGVSALLAPKVAMYTALVCRVHRPEYITNNLSPRASAFMHTHNYLTIPANDVLIPRVPDGSETAADTVSILLPNSTYMALSENTPNGSDPEQLCASDPEIQAIVARLNAVFTTSMGILSCLTTGWWGSLSDRYGRRIVVLIAVFGLFATDVIHVISARFADVLPGGYWFPLLGYLIEGLCGSVSTGVAINHAYLADTTHSSTRSRYFSLSLGFEFAGVAIGPVIGGLLLRSTGNLLSVFYFASVLHGAYTILLLFFLPESLTRARKQGAILRWKEEKAEQTSGDRDLPILSVITRFFSPLVVLLPPQLPDANPLERRRKDWSLFLLSVAYGLSMSVFGSLSYKFQYAAARFHWTPEITSYYISYIGATRAFFLAAILPLTIRFLAPKAVRLPSESTLAESQGAVGSSVSDNAILSPEADPSEQRVAVPRSAVSDLTLARVSVGLETTAFLGMATASTGMLFTLASTLASCGAGFPPAAQALALDIFTNRRAQNRGQVGKLFGALSVVQGLGAQIISPALYGFVYSSTVAVFPQAIMVLSTCTSLLALTFLSFVRIVPPKSQSTSDRDVPEHEDQQADQSVSP